MSGSALTFGGKTVYQNIAATNGELANAYYCPSGTPYGVGYVVLKENDAFELISSGGTAKDFVISQQYIVGGRIATNTLTLKNLYPLHCSRIGGGGVGRPTANTQFALLKFADVRFMLHRFGTSGKLLANLKEYNLPTATGGTTAVASTSEASWQSFVNTIWGKLPSALVGTAPTLPFSPDGVPANWQQWGGNAWRFLEIVLDKIGCEVIFDPTATSNWFSIIRRKTAQTVTVDSSATAKIIYRSESASSVASRIPEKVRVFFHKQFTAQPEWSATRMGQWVTDNPVYWEDISTSVSGAITGTLLEVWDDLAAETDAAGTISNASALTTRATERKTEIVDWLNRSDYLKAFRTYSGIEDIRNGSDVHAVRWRDFGADRGGLATDCWRGLALPQPPPGFESQDETDFCFESEVLSPPDLARRTWPNGFMVLGKTDSSIAKNASGTVSVYTGTALSETDTTRNITVYNKIGTINSTKWCLCMWFNGVWYLVAGECAT